MRIMGKLRLFEAYAGYGGSAFALTKAGIPFECVGYSEIHRNQIKIYEQNWAGHKNYGDITKIDVTGLPDFDLLTGGFPCQDVSIAGLRDLSKDRTNTVFALLDIIKIKKPKYCLLENVRGILSIEKGAYFNRIIEIIHSFGYTVSYKLLYSKEHGTPQTRPRVWIVCELDREGFMFNPFPAKKELDIFVQDLLEPEVDEKYYLSEKQLAYVIKRSEIRRKPLGLRINPKISTTIISTNPKSVQTTPIFVSSNIVGTIMSGPYSKGVYNNQFLIEDYGKIRCLTPKETFRLMGFFNDEINIEGICKTAAYYSAGNGWDINVASQIFKKWLTEK